MSGVVKSVKKVFKKVTKSVIGKIIIGVAVSFFTAGLGAAVLGATGLASGMSATMTTVLSHAISGAAAGGITSAVTGGDIGKGMLLGGVGGAVTGGAQSALGNYTKIPGQTTPSGAAGKVGVDQATTQATGTTAAVQETGVAANKTGLLNAAGGQPEGSGLTGVNDKLMGTAGVPGAPAPPAGAAAPAAAAGESGGLLSGVGKWVEDNQTAVTIGASTAVQGIGQGMMAKGQADAARETAEAERRAEAEKLAGIRASHEGMTGLMNPDAVAANRNVQGPRPTPSQRFDPAAYQGEYVYDPEQGRIVFVPRNRMA